MTIQNATELITIIDNFTPTGCLENVFGRDMFNDFYERQIALNPDVQFELVVRATRLLGTKSSRIVVDEEL
jgi:hypothetical protein